MRYIWWTAAGLLAVIVFCAALTSDVCAEAEDESPEPVLTGKVLHTEEWEQNRKNANRFYRERGKPEAVRDSRTFWSGEKFVLQASFDGDNPPESILVRIKGTDYKTRIFLSEGIYRGELFDEDMLYRWGQNRPEELMFLFETEYSAEGGENRRRSLSYICSVTVDDRQPYFMLHRKK